MTEFIVLILLIFALVSVGLISIHETKKNNSSESLEWIEAHKKINGELANLDNSLTELVQFSKINHVIAVKSRLYSEQVLETNEEPKEQQKYLSLPFHETEIAYLMKVPGIGKTKAENLLNYFGSTLEIKKATLEQLQEADQIGLKLAKSIKEQIN